MSRVSFIEHELLAFMHRLIVRGHVSPHVGDDIVFRVMLPRVAATAAVTDSEESSGEIKIEESC